MIQPTAPATATGELHNPNVSTAAVRASYLAPGFRSAQLHTMTAASAKKWLNTDGKKTIFGYQSNATPATNANVDPTLPRTTRNAATATAIWLPMPTTASGR